MNSDFLISPEQLHESARRLDAVGQDLATDAQAMLASVGDSSFLGTNDVLGALSSMMYELALQAFNETITSLVDELGAQAELLDFAADQYTASDEDAGTIASELGA